MVSNQLKRNARSHFQWSEFVFQSLNYTLLTGLSLLFVVPFLVVMMSSMVSEAELIRRGSFILIPESLDFAAYKLLLSKGSIIYNAYGVTLLRVVIGTALSSFLLHHKKTTHTGTHDLYDSRTITHHLPVQ